MKPTAAATDYLVAVAATATAVLLRWLLDPWMGNSYPFDVIFGAVAIAVWKGGYGPAYVATVLGLVSCEFLFIEPRGSVAIHHVGDSIGLVLFVATCFTIIGFGEAIQVSQRRFADLVGQQEQLLPPTSTGIEYATHEHSLRALVVIGFGLLLAVLVVGGVWGFLNIGLLSKTEQQVSQAHEVIGAVENVLSTLKDAETGQRGYLLRGNPEYLQPYNVALAEINYKLKRLKEIIQTPAQQERLRALEQKVGALLESLQRPVAKLQAGDRTGALDMIGLNKSKALMDDVRKDVAVMREEMDKLLEQRAEESKASSSVTKFSLLFTVVTGIVLLSVVFALSQRHLLIRQHAAQ
jgi:CHASE3 domain sensor protein